MTIEVQVRGNNVEKAMRVLKKKLLKDGLMRELKERQHYSKPSAVKREAKKQAIRRFKKEQKLKVEGTLLIKIGTLMDEKGTKTLNED